MEEERLGKVEEVSEVRISGPVRLLGESAGPAAGEAAGGGARGGAVGVKKGGGAGRHPAGGQSHSSRRASGQPRSVSLSK